MLYGQVSTLRAEVAVQTSKRESTSREAEEVRTRLTQVKRQQQLQLVCTQSTLWQQWHDTELVTGTWTCAVHPTDVAGMVARQCSCSKPSVIGC